MGLQNIQGDMNDKKYFNWIINNWVFTFNYRVFNDAYGVDCRNTAAQARRRSNGGV